jgi:catechol 2,3-dioxygenase-like lactoylglutathione lyase family enzyme
MFDHIGIRVKDLPASKAFYTTLLSSIGCKIIMTLDDGSGVHAYGKHFPSFWLTPQCSTDETKSHTSGPAHIAFSASNRAQVDAFYAAGMKAGAKSNGPPGVRKEYHRYYYGCYLHDLDGNNIECVCHWPPALLILTSWPVILGGLGIVPLLWEITDHFM